MRIIALLIATAMLSGCVSYYPRHHHHGHYPRHYHRY